MCMGCKKGTKTQVIRSYTCIRCKEAKEQRSCGRLRELCDSCKNKKNPCECGCGGFVKASHNDSHFISGHNTFSLTKEELSERNQKAAASRIENGNHIPSDETKAKISRSVVEKYKDPEYMEKFLEANRNRAPFSDEARANMSKAKNTPLSKGYLSKAMKQKWLDGKFDDRKDYSKQEVATAPAFKKLGYKSSAIDRKFYITKGNRTKIPDFYDYKNKRVLEIFGLWWHKRIIKKDGTQHETPEELIQWYAEQGWECIVLWEDEVDDYLQKHLGE